MIRMEIACDESGAEGETLIGGNTNVFAHGSVRLSVEAAADCIREARDRIRSPATEYKANHLLRAKHRKVLMWLLGPDGPITGAAHAYLIDKPYFLITRIVEVLIGEPALAPILYQEGRRALPSARWQEFLRSCNNLLRAKSRPGTPFPVQSFFATVEALAADSTGRLGEILGSMPAGWRGVAAYRDRSPDDPTGTVDPLIPGLIRTIEYWVAAGDPAAIVHDFQSALTPGRLARIRALTGAAEVTLADSSADPRVQVADFLAGIARKITEDRLTGRGDDELIALLRPYLDDRPIWVDQESWAALSPRPTRPAACP